MKTQKLFGQVKEKASLNKDKIRDLEKQLLLKEYELKDIENEKQIKT